MIRKALTKKSILSASDDVWKLIRYQDTLRGVCWIFPHRSTWGLQWAIRASRYLLLWPKGKIMVISLMKRWAIIFCHWREGQLQESPLLTAEENEEKYWDTRRVGCIVRNYTKGAGSLWNCSLAFLKVAFWFDVWHEAHTVCRHEWTLVSEVWPFNYSELALREDIYHCLVLPQPFFLYDSFTFVSRLKLSTFPSLVILL